MQTLGLPLGVAVVTEAEQLPAAVLNCFGYSETALIERYVEGTELAVTVLGPGGRTRRPAARRDHRGQWSLRLLGALHRRCDGVPRTDCIVDAAGVPQFLEVNVSPGLTETSLVPLAVAAEGLDLRVVLRDLMQAAVHRADARPELPS